MTDSIKQETPQETLARHRSSIDNMDNAFIHILAERFRVTGKVSLLKARYRDELLLADRQREKDQVIRLRSLAEQSGLDPDLAEKFILLLIHEVTENHKRARL